MLAAIATAIEPEVLLVDEVLSAGDLNFQHKARARMREMMAKAHLFVMVSHDLDSLQKLCDRYGIGNALVLSAHTDPDIAQANRYLRQATQAFEAAGYAERLAPSSSAAVLR